MSRERGEQAAGRQRAEQQSHQLHKALQEQEDEVKRLKWEAERAAQAAERTDQQIEHLSKEFTEAAVTNAGQLFIMQAYTLQ